MSDDLVERVARAACASVNSADTWEETGTDVHEMVWFPIARAAIAVCMEEAAKVAAAMPRTYTKIKEDHDVLGMTGTWTFTLNNGPAECAAAIRALVKEPQ